MPWVKTNVEDDQINETIERVQEKYDMNKSEATLFLLSYGVEHYNLSND